jgi:hypothetical protein
MCVQGQCTGSMACDSGVATSDAKDADAEDDAAFDGQEQPDAATDAPATDGSDATTNVTGATAPWTPAALPGVVLWLEADWGVNTSPGTSAVSLWSDRSGQANDAVQPVMENTPRLVFDAIGGMASLRFADPSWMTVIDQPSLRWGLGDFTLMVVERMAFMCARCQGQQLFFHKSEEAMPYYGLQVYLKREEHKLWAFLATHQEVYINQSDSDVAAHLFSVRRRVTTLEGRVDGVVASSVQTPSPVNLDAPGRHGHIGAHGYSGDLFQFEGDIAAMIAVKGALSDDDLARLEGYLLVKYGIPVSTRLAP